MIKPVRLGLVREEHAEHDNEDYAASQETQPRTGSRDDQAVSSPPPLGQRTRYVSAAAADRLR